MLKELQAAPVDLYIDQGDTYYKVFTLHDNVGSVIDLTTLTFACTMKRYTNTGTTYALVPVVVDPTTGQFALTMTSTVSSSLVYDKYAYAVTVTNGTDVVKIMYGQVLVTSI